MKKLHVALIQFLVSQLSTYSLEPMSVEHTLENLGAYARQPVAVKGLLRWRQEKTALYPLVDGRNIRVYVVDPIGLDKKANLEKAFWISLPKFERRRYRTYHKLDG